MVSGHERVSVSVYSRKEMQGLFDGLLRFVRDGPDALNVSCVGMPSGYPKTGGERAALLAWALECAWIAQYAAGARTYVVRAERQVAPGAFNVAPLCVDLRRARSDLDAVALAERLSNVLYNTVSNGGTDFCPTTVRDLLQSVRLQLYARAAAQATWVEHGVARGPCPAKGEDKARRRKTGGSR